MNEHEQLPTTAAETLYQDALAAILDSDMERAHELATTLCKVSPEDFDNHQIAGVSALSLGHTQTAFKHFSEAVRLADTPPLSAVAWCGIGQTHLMQESPPQQAESAFRRALSLVCEFPPALAGLAEALNRQARRHEAEHTALRAHELGFQNAQLETTLGYALLGQDKIEEALEAFKHGQTMEPTAYEPRIGMATVAVYRGDFETSERIYREIMVALPRYPIYERLASLKTFSADDPDIQMMVQRLSELPEDAPLSVRADIHFALAKSYDDIDDIEHATMHLQKGNHLEHQRMPFDPERDQERARRIMRLVTDEFVKRYTNGGLTDIRPIFIVSLPRSGSTLTEQMLASHSRIRGGGELGFLAQVASALGAKWAARSDFPNMETGAAQTDLREAAHEYAGLTASLRLVQPYFTDKSLGNFRYIGLIPMMLPDARIVHVRRHPLAIALSLYRLRFARGIDYSSDLDHIVHNYQTYARLMAHWKRTVPNTFTEVYYEALISDPERELRHILEYIGLEFEPACLEFYRLKRPVRTASVVQVRQPLDHSGLDRHKRYQKLLHPVAEALAKEISIYEHELAAHLAKSEK